MKIEQVPRKELLIEHDLRALGCTAHTVSQRNRVDPWTAGFTDGSQRCGELRASESGPLKTHKVLRRANGKDFTVNNT
jgi:hypothetical protein